METQLSVEALARALCIRDLTDAAQGPHAIQLMIVEIIGALTRSWRIPSIVHRAPRIVRVEDNYDCLRIAGDAVTRDARYTRWVDPNHLLRSHTSALMPQALAMVARLGCADLLVACPGIVYRRDCIDRLHVGEPHQIDVWRVRRGAPLCETDLRDMTQIVLAAALPGRRWRATSTEHPYTTDGRQIDVEPERTDDGEGGAWIELGECGLAHGDVLARAGLAPEDGWSGLAMGLGLDRAVMLRKRIDDIRLLRAPDPRIASQMVDLAPYRPVSRMPAAARDLSLAIAADDRGEDLGDRVRAALGGRADLVEEVRVLSETPYDALPDAARERMGMRPGLKNVLVRVVLRALERSIRHEEANELRDAIYGALHRGDAHEWASPDRARP